MRISIHDILAKLHKVFNQLILAGVIILCGVTGLLVMGKETPPMEKNHPFTVLKEDFLRAVRAYDIKSAKRIYAYLKEKNPYAPFVEEAAPAYLADIYLYYANKMAFNPEAADVFLAEARRLAPNHPLLVASLPKETIAVSPVEPAWIAKTQALSSQIVETEKVVAAETKAYVDEMVMLEQTIEAIERYRMQQEADRLKGMLAQIEAIEEPSLPEINVTVSQESADISAEKLALLSPEVDVIEAEPAPESLAVHTSTDDACLLSYYTRNAPVSTCMDVVSENQYGPALFVIGEEGASPLAFTQQPITRDAFNALCEESKKCATNAPVSVADANVASGLNLDLSDVENTVQSYNSFCQMTQNCTGLVSATANALLEQDKLSEYVKVLSEETGYSYRLMTVSDVKEITAYFEQCVEREQCDPTLGADLSQFLKAQQGVLLVRGMAAS